MNFLLDLWHILLKRDIFKTSFKIKKKVREFPGSSVVRMLCFHCREPRFDPWSGN